MGLAELFLLAVGLSMDAFAVSVCKGLAMQKCTAASAGITGLYFGGFQALMPVIGYCMGVRFKDIITSVDHWIAFFLLAAIGGNMIREALSKDDDCACGEDDGSLDVRTMLALSVATSIDALAVGVTFAFLQVSILPAAAFIGVTTFTISAAGVKIGTVCGNKYQAKAEVLGGVILILIGIKILMEHLGILS